MSLKQESHEKAMTISILMKRIETIEGILRSLKQRYALQCQLGD